MKQSTKNKKSQGKQGRASCGRANAVPRQRPEQGITTDPERMGFRDVVRACNAFLTSRGQKVGGFGEQRINF